MRIIVPLCMKLHYPSVQGIHQPYNGGCSDKKNDGGYDIGELATSSLQGKSAASDGGR